MDRPLAPEVAPDEITFREFLEDVRRAKTVFICLMGFLTLGGVLIGIFGQKEYEATTVLLPVSEEVGSGAGGLAQLASQYSGLASLAGINLPGTGARDEAIAVLQSELLTERYIEQNDLLPILYAAKWDPASRSWKTRDPRKIPTLWLANKFFKNDVRTVVDDKKTGMVEMTVRWKNPVLAAQWANGLVTLTNAYLRDKAIQEAQRNIAYLNGLVTGTNVVQEQEVIYSLMQQQIDKEMIARDRQEYALKVIDPAYAPDKPSSHGPIGLGILGMALGSFLGLIVVFVRRALAA